MKKILLVLSFFLASLPHSFSALVFLTTMLNDCIEYWEVRNIELNESGQIIRNDLVSSGTVDHCDNLAPGATAERHTSSEKIYFHKQSKSSVRFSLFPNPGTAIRQVSFQSENPLDNVQTIVTLVDIQGREQTIWRGTLSGKTGMLENLHFDDLPKGSYFVIFKMEGQPPVSLQFVKTGGR